MILVLGDVMTDIVAQLAEPLAYGSDAAAAICFRGGGSAANTAAWLAATGTPVRLVARIGADELGRKRAAELAASGVGLALAVDPSRPTGTCVVLVEPGGERTMLPDRGANLALEPADLPPLTGVEHVHVSGYCLLHDGPRAAALVLMEAARREGVPLSLDAASAAPLLAAGPSRFAGWAAGALVVANAAEAQVLPDRGEVVVKLGAAGAQWRRDGAVLASAAAVRAEIVDTTGAGDAFAAGLLAARARGADEAAALAAGAVLAARCVATPGGRPEAPAGPPDGPLSGGSTAKGPRSRRTPVLP